MQGVGLPPTERQELIRMDEGWYEDEYLILFAEDEIPLASERYGVSSALPGFQVVGLRGWDDLIVRDSGGETFTVPAVPLDAKHLEPFSVPAAPVPLAKDSDKAGKIKWYVKPIAFGGDPSVGQNLMWVTHDQHAQLVRWWNDQYRALAPNAEGQHARPGDDHRDGQRA